MFESEAEAEVDWSLSGQALDAMAQAVELTATCRSDESCVPLHPALIEALAACLPPNVSATELRASW